ncbi:DUF3047 domain-containing protein [Thalassolituus sp. LLYu03]|uniref:DUF3047 domain-containing protein n=1 Tax=Thalassolituus sp. LLYu03 TaxID=3421656 RepID=UPI003D279116
MYIYSKKSRRRMHAIPAAIALGLVALLWLANATRHTHAEQVLSAQNLSQWESDCRHCDISSQYDILQGDVVHLSSQGDLNIERELNETPANPKLSWRWSVDTYVDGGTLIRITLHVKETDNWPERTLHYVWDSAQEAGAIEALSDFEHRIVVTGAEAKAENWYKIARDLNSDWAAIYNEPLPPLERIEVGLGMAGDKAVTGAFLDSIVLISDDSVPPQQPAIAINE